ncbi:helix-turn-helix transcriptional regulator [Brevibacillus laterosporus]|uniref:helix-turn-helix domain-containing protein n=1 Tax=Brevibacillus laterosporus TaxID=1465 RepID=UPI003D207AD1
MSKLGDRLKETRENKNLKQTQVKVYTGINNKTLSGYENGVSEPDVETLRTLANLYEVSVDWLVGNICDSDIQDSTSYAEEIKKFKMILASLPRNKHKHFLEQISIFAAGIIAVEKKYNGDK